MISRPLVLGLVAAGCVTAAAGGAFVALRQNAADTTSSAPVPSAASQPQPVTETEAVVTPSDTPPAASAGAAEAPEPSSAPARVERREPSKPAPAPVREPRPEPVRAQPSPQVKARNSDPVPPAASETAPRETAAAPAPVPPLDSVPGTTRLPEAPPTRPEPQFVEVVVPSSAVIGLQMDRSLSSETARMEDRVEARVTRDVMSDGRCAIPAGSRVLGSVVLVERGGKVKETARLGIRFHTLVLGDGTQVPLRTETIYRDGDPPTGESARKIGGAAVGGAILGAILGGGKGAMIGGATGAAGGTAAVMAGGRNPATIASGTVVTARLDAPVTIQVQKD